MDFKQFIQSKALEDRLAFGISFDVNPGELRDIYPTVTVGGFILPQLNELTVGEAWFFDLLSVANEGRKSDIRFMLQTIAAELQVCCGLESLSQAVSELFKPSATTASNPEYEKFLGRQSQKLQKLVELSQLVENDLAMNWLKVTYFLLSRYNGEWTMSKTASLRQSQVNELMDFILLEVNKGVMPEVVDPNMAMEDVMSPESAGKELVVVE